MEGFPCVDEHKKLQRRSFNSQINDKKTKTYIDPTLAAPTNKQIYSRHLFNGELGSTEISNLNISQCLSDLITLILCINQSKRIFHLDMSNQFMPTQK